MLTDTQLLDFMDTLADPAHLKNTQNGKYIVSNKHNSALFGIDNPSQLVGLTVKDINLFNNQAWWQNYAKIVDSLDSQVIINKTTVNDKRAILTNKGIRYQKMVKFPVVNNLGKVSSLLTFSQNLTNQLKLKELYELYKNFYDKQDAVWKFLEYLEINPFFIDKPTEAELYVLLTKCLIDGNKQISLELDISARTVETHISKLRYKIKNGNMNFIIMQLRQKHAV